MNEVTENNTRRLDKLRNGWSSINNHSLVIRIRGLVGALLDKLLPPFAPLIDLDEKLVRGEVSRDHAIIHHYLEFQILFGLLGSIAGLFLIFTSSSHGIYFIFLVIASILLILTGFEIEEIYITSKRLMVRRIGTFERIIRIPSDEEHLLEHLVSYRIGRAPFNLALIGFSLLSLFTLFDGSIPIFTQFILFLSALIIFIYALRLGKRSVTLEFAGGHQVILGLRKGIPYHLLRTMMDVIYEEEEDQSESSNEVTIQELTDYSATQTDDDQPKPADV